jgi:predicted Fe-Mo cluster-binding NifX family protein
MTTRIAIPLWQDRVSPVFDTAARVLLVDVDGSGPLNRFAVDLPNGSLRQRATRLAENGTDVLICGAISRPLCELVEAAGVKVKPFLSGPLDELIHAFVEGSLSDSRFAMPGCGNRRRRKRRRRARKEKQKESS